MCIQPAFSNILNLVEKARKNDDFGKSCFCRALVPCIIVVCLMSGCGDNLSNAQEKASFISCEAIASMESKGITGTLPYSEKQAIRDAIYSDAIHALSGGSGKGPMLHAPLICK
jgi:hypothetical protein